MGAATTPFESLRTLRVLHVIPSLSTKEGGPSFAVQAMAAALAQQGDEVTIAATRLQHSSLAGWEVDEGGDEAPATRRLSAVTTADGYRVICFRRNFEPYKVSFGLTKWLRQNIAAFDVVHIHALFSFSSTVAARIARRNNVPCVVRPLGVLNRWGLQNRRRILKIVSLRFLELPILRNAAAIHFTSKAEREEAMELDGSLRESSVVIPLPISPALPGDAELFRNRYPQLRDRKIILFLSRIDRKKGLELLLDAFAQVNRGSPETLLVIAGEGSAEYKAALSAKARALGIEKDIVWVGFLGGPGKADALAAASIIVLPSHSENFGIAVAEALAAGVPAIVTSGVGISEYLREYDAGLVVPGEAGALASGIERLLRDPSLAGRLAQNGLRLVAEQFSPAAVAAQLRALYLSSMKRTTIS